MDVLENRSQCPSTVVGALIDLISVALTRGTKREEVDFDDIEHLVNLLHLLRPDSAELSFFDGWLKMLRGEWSEAEDIFRGLVERAICVRGSQSMLLRCLKERDAYGWQDEAHELVEAGGGDDLVRVAKTLLAGEDLKHALANARRTGRFIAPESVRALNDEALAQDNGEVAAPSQSSDEMLLTLQYMRI